MAAANPVVTAQVIQRYRSTAGGAVFLAVLAVLAPVTVLAFVLPLPTVLAIGVLGLLLLPWFWRAPIRGLYLLMAGALLIEIFPLGFADSLTDRIPLFLNLNNSANLQGIPITPAELLLIAATLIWIARAMSTRSLRWPRGPLVPAYLTYLVVVLLAEVNGLLSGGAFLLSLWELRPQVYGFLLFVLATSLVTTRMQLRRLAMLFAVCVALKGLIGSYRYLVTLHGNLGNQELLAHEESYFLGLFLVAVVVAFIWLRQRRILVPMLILSAPVIFSLLANERRVGVFAAEAGVGVVVLLAARFEASLRKRIVQLSILALAAYVVFAIAYWNHDGGLTGQLVRPLRTALGQQVDARDLSSDQYRVAENANLSLSFHSAPVIGMGFGRPFLTVIPLADISQYYSLWNVIPHNTLLWIGVRMGTVGYLAFFGLIGMAIIQATNQLASRRDPLLRAFAAFTIAAIVSELIVGWGDLQLENYRNLIFLGALLGILNRLPEMADA